MHITRSRLLLLILAQILSLSSWQSISAKSFKYFYKDVLFSCKTEGEFVCIKDFDPKAEKVQIPSVVYDGNVAYQVSKISTFINGKNFLCESIVIEEGISNIDKFAFNECRNLSYISLPSSILSIGKNAIRLNASLVIVAPSSIHYLLTDKIRGKDVSLITPDKDRRTQNLASTAQPDKSEQNITNATPSVQPPVPEKKEQPKTEETIASPQASPQTTQPKLEASTKTQKNNNTDKPTGSKSKTSSKSKKTKTSKAVAEAATKQETNLDTDVPITKARKENTYCVIIANENYKDAPKVDYAHNDGKIIKEYFIKTLGVPENQVQIHLDATYTGIKRAINWINNMDYAVDGDAKFIIFYAGHGIPGEADRCAYLLPADGIPSDISTCFSMDDMYQTLGKLKAQSVTVFMDACFTGAAARGQNQPLVASRAVNIAPNTNELPGNLVVFSATNSDQSAMAYNDKNHGMFTYFLLNTIRDSKGNIDYGTLFDNVSKKVRKESMLENGKLQTPTVNVSESLSRNWRQLRF